MKEWKTGRRVEGGREEGRKGRERLRLVKEIRFIRHSHCALESPDASQ